jgi:uncharacterized repeat protein (TIGR03806 family)
MSDRSLSRASWVAFAAFTGALYLVSSCARDSATAEQSDSVPATTSTQTPADTAVPDDPSTTDGAAAAAMPPAGTPELLSDWSQLDARNGELVMLDGVTPYALNSALFSDYAHKLRTVWMPDGAAAAMSDPDDTFDFPVGTVITKTFYYPDSAGTDEVLLTESDDRGLAAPLALADVRLVETRVLVHRDDGWHAFPYVWDDEETEATLQRTGDVVPLAAVSDDGIETPLTYVVPDVNQCASCHAANHTTGAIAPIGPKARHLNRAVDFGDGPESQLDHWQESGLLTDAPAATEMPSAVVWDDETAPLEDRARAYLDINCAHCHSPVGAADTSGLFLDIGTEVGPQYGICKAPIAAGGGSGGRLVDISPGAPDESIITYRMGSTEPASMMPELGRSLSHDEGVDLIAEWIESLDGDC